MTSRKLLPLAGIVFVALVVVAVVVGGGTPEPDATGSKIASFYDAHQASGMVSAFALATSVLFLVLFSAALSTIAGAGERSVWQHVLGAGGVLGAAALLVGATVHFALAGGAGDLSQNALQALNAIDGDIWMALNPALGILMLGAAGLSLAEAGLPRWLGWAALVLGVALFVQFADFFALLASGPWIVVAAIVLFRGRGGAEARVTVTPQVATR